MYNIIIISLNCATYESVGHKRFVKGGLSFRIILAYRPMTKNMKRTVLYEVIQQKYGKLPTHKKLGRSYRAEALQGASSQEKSDESSPQQKNVTVRARTVSKMFGLPPRKHGLSISYPVVVVLMLALVMALLGTFRLGQLYGPIDKKPPTSDVVVAEEYVDSTVLSRADTLPEAAVTPEVSAAFGSVAEEESAKPAGDHVIVIATYKRGEDLVPVKEYFDKNGIETEIQEKGYYYFLVTKNKFQSPRRDGTDGYYALERIKQVGANYEAPQGYESFAPNLFQDAYGMKIR